MRKEKIIAASAILVLLLSACGSKPAKHAATASSKVTTTAQKKTPRVKKSGYDIGWNGTKADQLRNYMADFGETMNQKYDEVTAASDTSFMGTNLGTYIKDKKQVTINGTTQTVRWLPGAHNASKTKENVLAVYADTSDNILYLFTKKAADTQVLVTQAAPKDGTFSFKATANSDIQNAFASIIAGKAAPKPQNSSKATATSSKPTKTAANDKNNLDPKADGSTPAQQFPSWLQGTWYSYDQDTDDIHVIVFTKNRFQTPSTPPVYAYDANHRDANDMKWQNGDMSATIPYRENNWIEALPTTVQGHPAVNIRGWYQSAGAGETYYVVNQNVHGQNIPVVTDGSGAGAWGSTHYFKSKALAQQNRDAHFSSDQTN